MRDSAPTRRQAVERISSVWPASRRTLHYARARDAGRIPARAWGIVLAVVLHGAVVMHLFREPSPPHRIELPKPIAVSFVEVARPKPPEPVVEPPKPKPVVRRPPPRPKRPVRRPDPPPVPVPQPTPVEAPVIASSAPVSTAANEVPPPEPEPAPAPAPAPVVAPAPPPPPPVVEPRFDAAYLNNPAPSYPSVSRRLGEQGRVLLRVHVDERGMPMSVNVRTSSGYERLDKVALDTVRRWKFVPARRGEEPVSAWVLVPIVFNLRS